MEWIKDYWWLILLLLLGIFLNAIRDLKNINYKSYLDKKNGLKSKPPVSSVNDADNDDNDK